MRTTLSLLLLGSAAGLAPAMPETVTAPVEQPPQQEVVVLLHGMGRSVLSMKRLEWTLSDAGYRVVEVSYPSTRRSVEQLAEQHLAPVLTQVERAGARRVHFVTHSLGGIVLRHHLATHTISNLGRTVMLGPPNQGSEVADKLKGWRLYRLLTGPSGQQLGTGEGGLPRSLGPARFEVGIIAGDWSFNPIFSHWLPGPDDGKVSVAGTRLDGMNDFLVVRASHSWLPWRKAVVRQVVAFLETGKFVRT